MNKYRIKLKRILKDFSQKQSDCFPSGIFGNYYKHSVNASYDKWRLVRFLFDEILNFQIIDQPMEKINWEIPFIYKKVYQCSASHQKFGFRIYIKEKNKKIAEDIAREIETLINKAIDKSEPLIKEYAIQALKSGEISVDNRLASLKKPYEYFKSQVMIRKSKINELNNISIDKIISKDLEKLFEAKEEIDYLEHAGYVAFFSLLEHLCVLMLAFKDIPKRKDVKEFSNKNWQDKYKIIFDVKDKNFKEAFDYLLGIARYRRNPNVHGFSDRLHTTFNFYLPSAKHRIPVNLYMDEIIVKWKNTELNFKKLDAFLELLRQHKSTKRTMRYLEESLNVSFSKTWEYFDIPSYSDKEFNEFLDYEINKFDNLANMDW